jgi:hypothetical protein
MWRQNSPDVLSIDKMEWLAEMKWMGRLAAKRRLKRFARSRLRELAVSILAGLPDVAPVRAALCWRGRSACNDCAAAHANQQCAISPHAGLTQRLVQRN